MRSGRVAERWAELGFDGEPAELPLLADVSEEHAPTTAGGDGDHDDDAYSM